MLTSDQKKSLRQHYRHLRHHISIEEKKLAAESVAQLFLKNFSPHQKNIAVYWAHDGELELQFLIEQLWKIECSVFLPVIHPDSGQLCFVRYRESTFMKKNRYGIDEPESMSECILPQDLDIVLMPLIAFNDHGVRLGMGKGYYDQSFAFCRLPHNKPGLIGVGYQCQRCESLPADAWDVPLDGVITEEKCMLLRGEL